MIDLLRLCRLYYAVPMALIMALSIWYVLGDRIRDQWSATLAATCALALVISGGYALNDVCDQRADRANAPHRPIPAGRTSVRAAALWSAALFAAGLLTAWICQWQFRVLLASVAAALIFYDVCSKHLRLAKQLLVAALMTSIYPLAISQTGWPTGSRAATLYVFPVWVFLVSFGYETLKDIDDAGGDRLASARTSWVQRHPRRALVAARITIVAGSVALLGPAAAGCRWVYLAIIPAAIALGLAAAWLAPGRARIAIYAQFVVVGIAAVADIMVLGC